MKFAFSISILLFFLSQSALGQSRNFWPHEPKRVQLNPVGESYVDNELMQKDPYSGKIRMVFQDTINAEAWVADINPLNGEWLNRNNAGKDYFVADNIAPMSLSKKGPHFGYSNGSYGPQWKLYYNKIINGSAAIYSAWPNFGEEADPIEFQEKVLISDGNSRLNPLASQSFEADATRVLYAGLGSISYLNEAQAMYRPFSSAPDHNITHSILEQNSFRWVRDSKWAITTLNSLSPLVNGQIQRTDSEQSVDFLANQVMTKDDLGLKFDPQAWHDPVNYSLEIYKENMMALGATHNKSKITVYRPPLHNETFWQPLFTIDPQTNPHILKNSNTGQKYVQSPEAYYYKGKSYVVATIKNANSGITSPEVTGAEVWLWNVTDYVNERLTPPILISDGGSEYKASEGEFLEIRNQLVIYYGRLPASGSQMFDLMLTKDFLYNKNRDPRDQTIDASP